MVYAAGDMVECAGEPAESATAATARLIPDGAPVPVLGGAAYRYADAATLAASLAVSPDPTSTGVA